MLTITSLIVQIFYHNIINYMYWLCCTILTFLHGLGLTSNDALNFLLCAVLSMVLGRLGALLFPNMSTSSKELSSSAKTGQGCSREDAQIT